MIKLEELLERLEAEKAEAPDRLARRIEAYRLKVQGYSYQDIADKIDVSYPTAVSDVQWAIRNLPTAIETTEDFTKVTIDRIEQQLAQLSGSRAAAEDAAHRTSATLMDLQARLLGVMTSKTEVSAHVNYVVEGVDMDKL